MPILDLGYVKGPQGEPGYTPVKGVDYFDGAQGPEGPAGKDGSDYILTEADKAEIAGMVEAPEQYKIGDGLYHDADNNEIGVNFENTLGVNSDNQLGVIQENLYVISNSYLPINFNVGPIPVESELVIFSVGMRYDQTEVEDWLAQMASNPRTLHLKIGTTTGSFGGKAVPVVSTDATAADGQMYSYVFDMNSAIGPNAQTNLGIMGVYICYNFSGRFTVIIERDISIALGDINRVEWGINDTVQSMAHYFIGRNSQFNKYRNNGNDYIEINENYINGLIDNKLDAIQVAEEVSV